MHTTRQHPPFPFPALAFLLVGAWAVPRLASCGGGAAPAGGGGGGGDVSPPSTLADPDGGAYPTPQDVTLTSSETATIYYTTDGTTPAVGGTTTQSGPSPISGITMGLTSSTLRFFGLDLAGNAELPRTEVYTVDPDPPEVSTLGPPPEPIGVLDTVTVRWLSSEAGDFSVELGGTGTMESGTVIDSGSVQAGVLVDAQVPGTDLDFDFVLPLWVYVSDAAGNVGSVTVDLSLKPLGTIAVQPGTGDMEILPSGLRGYVVQTAGDAVLVIDTDPSSPSYNQVIGVPAVSADPNGLSPTPDGTRVYVTCADDIVAIETVNDTVLATIPIGAGAQPTGIDVHPDGTRAYFTTADGSVQVLDVDPASGTYHQFSAIPVADPLLRTSQIEITPDGALALVAWKGVSEYSAWTIDVDANSATLHQILATLVPLVVLATEGRIEVAPDSVNGFLADETGKLKRTDLLNPAVVVSSDEVPEGLALSTDAATLILYGPASTDLRFLDAQDLSFGGADVALGNELGLDLALTPDGTRLYIARDNLSPAAEILVVPLL